MGMFDRLHYQGKVYQTKDLDCTLDDLEIVNGRLVHDEWHYETVPKEERPYPDAEDIRQIFGSMRRVIDRKAVDLNYHGYLYLVAEDGEYKRYQAKFTDGNLVSFEEQLAD